MLEYDFLAIGGGAAGFFAAINTKIKNPSLKVGIIEKQGKFLQKVKVSGGGRCNVTNAISDPETLSNNYPRGKEFLLEPFKSFNTSHTQFWFKERGVTLKTEKDGRVFPVTDSSQTIIDCFLKESKDIDLILNSRVESFIQDDNYWKITLADGKTLKTKYLLIASGSDKRIWDEIDRLKLNIKEQVPSLFTFNIPDTQLQNLQGISFPNARIKVTKSDLIQEGPLLITHWGLSGPAILKLSAWGAYLLKERDYKFQIEISWIAKSKPKDIEKELRAVFEQNPKKNIRSMPISGLTQRFWNYICDKSNISEFQKGAETGKKQIAVLIENLTAAKYQVDGKSTFKEEFVTAGGVDLEEINSSDFSCVKYSNLFFAGEVLNIDAITGGFNFQAAWTAGWMISERVSKN